MKFQLFFFLFIPSLLFPLQTAAQNKMGTIKGIVTSRGKPLEAVNAGIENIGKGAPTDSNGVFIIRNIRTGTYELSISAIGYQKHRQEVMVKANNTLSLNIQLIPKREELGEVVVSGTMRETYIKESPVKVVVIKPRRLLQGHTSSNIMDLIGSVNGLSTQLNCGVCGTNAIRINGVEGANTAVLIDGMPVMGALASVYGLNGISPSIIDQVEVIKGPQSTLYGTQALGGVVNIITKNPENTPSLSADAYVKSTEETSINLAASPKTDRFKSFISANILRMENYFDKNNDHFNDVAKRTSISLFGKTTLLGRQNQERLNVAAKFYDENRTGGVSTFSDEIRGSNQIYGESIYTRRAELMGEYRPPGLDQRLRFSGALTHHDQNSYYGTEHYDAQQNIIFGQATWDQSIQENIQLLLGGTIRYQTYNDNTPATSQGINHRFIPGVFAQSEFTFGDLKLLGGIRFDHHSKHRLVTAPRLSVKYHPSELTTLRLSSGTGFRIVNVFTEDHAALTGSREVIFTEDLEPEQSRSITAGIEHIIPFKADPLTLSLDGFYTHFSNKIIPDYDQNPNLIVYENLDGFSVTRGLSIDMDQNFTTIPFSYNFSFTLMDVFTQENGQRRSLTYAPGYTGSWGFNYQLRSWDLEIGYTGNLTGPKRLPDNYVQDFGRSRWSPAHTTHSIKISREFMNVNSTKGIGLETYISVENLFDYTQGSPLVDASDPFGPRFDTIYTWGPVIGRTFSIGARLNIK